LRSIALSCAALGTGALSVAAHAVLDTQAIVDHTIRTAANRASVQKVEQGTRSVIG
jgi:hypothetical protein